MNPILQTRLLSALEAGTLVVLCGAGLSMAAPSSLPSAKWVANYCYDKWNAISPIDPNLRDRIDDLAEHFHSSGLFPAFIETLIPWNELTGLPNEGHAALGDFLITRAARGVLSSNFDPLIEVWSGNHKVAMRGALDGIEAVKYGADSNPLLKFHGCMQQAREETIWTASQFLDPKLAARQRSCSDWMNLNLPGCHLLVVGFWSDWDYLNKVFTDSFTAVGAASVTVVNPEDSASLELKARDLWVRLRAAGGSFEHVRSSGDQFLSDLRTAFSQSWMRKVLSRASALMPAPPAGFAMAAAAPALSLEDLYDARRDLEGVSYSNAGVWKDPLPSATQAALLRMRLLEQGGTPERSWITLAGSAIRVVNGGGRSLSEMENNFKEAPSAQRADAIVCAGSIRLGVPGVIITKGTPSGFVRPAPGSGSIWLTTEEAEVQFGL